MPRLLLVVCLVVSVSLGATEHWTHTGPPGGIVTAVAFHPTNGAVAWIGTSGGVHKSTDGGATWSLLTTSPGGTTVTGMVIHPNAPAVIYLATSSRGVWKTTDGGSTWIQKSSGLYALDSDPDTYGKLNDIAIDSADPMTLYAATVYGHIVKTTDAGESWFDVDVPEGDQETIAVDPKNSDIYVGAERGLYRSNDGGATWSATTNFPASNFGWPRIEDIDFDTSTTPSTVWVASMGGGVSKSTDSGASWTRVGGSLITYAYSVARAPGGGSTLYVGGYNESHTLTPHSIFKSTNGGASWVQQSSGISGSRIEPIAVSPTDSAKVLAGSRTSNHLLRSLDGGSSWSLVIEGIRGIRTSDVFYQPSEDMLLAGSLDTIYRSLDEGHTWSRARMIEMSRVVKVRHNGDYLALLDTAECPAVETPYLLLRSASGASWDVLGDVGASHRMYDVAVSPSHPQIAYATMTDDVSSGIIKSVDGGASWTKVMSESAWSFAPIAIHPTNPNIVYAGMQWGVFKSADGGGTWSRVTPDSVSYVTALAVNPSNPDHLVGGGISRIFETIDGGATWGMRDPFKLSSLSPVHDELYPVSIVFAPGSSGAFYVATRKYGVFRSTDGGRTLDPFGTGLRDPQTVAMIAGANGSLHVATLGDGIYSTGQQAAPTAVVSGSTSVCNGSTATLSVALTGAAPWTLKWSDGVTQTGIAASPATRQVAPSLSTTYSIIEVSDSFGTGTASGSAAITVKPSPSASIKGPISMFPSSTGNVVSVQDAGNGATYTWSAQNATITAGAGTRSITVTVGTVSPVSVAVTVTKDGCSARGERDFAVSEQLLGDANGSGTVDVADVFYLINYLFAGGAAPIGSGDANADGTVAVSDIFYLINHLFT